MKTLEERIAALEKSNRRWRYGAALFAIAAIGVAGARPTATTDLVRTHRLEVVDDAGMVVAEIANDTLGGGQMSIFEDG